MQLQALETRHDNEHVEWEDGRQALRYTCRFSMVATARLASTVT